MPQSTEYKPKWLVEVKVVEASDVFFCGSKRVWRLWKTCRVHSYTGGPPQIRVFCIVASYQTNLLSVWSILARHTGTEKETSRKRVWRETHLLTTAGDKNRVSELRRYQWKEGRGDEKKLSALHQSAWLHCGAFRDDEGDSNIERLCCRFYRARRGYLQNACEERRRPGSTERFYKV